MSVRHSKAARVNRWQPARSDWTQLSNVPSPTVRRSTPAFSKQGGRVELHLSGMRGAPARPSLAADYGSSNQARPQSAISMLRGGGDAPPGFGKSKPPTYDRPPPERVRKHVPVAAWDKGLSREQWSSQVLR